MVTMEHNTVRRRTTQRQPLSCTECARRKIRCSKVIPCGACIDAGHIHLCRREDVQVRKRSRVVTKRTERVNTATALAQEQPKRMFSVVPSGRISISSPVEAQQIQDAAQWGERHFNGTEVGPSTPSPAPQRLIDGVAQNAAVTLEFLALGRQRVMQIGSDTPPVSPGRGPLNSVIADPVVTAAQARSLMIYHEENMAWMHNVVHLPTFREQCNKFLENGEPVNKFWLPLYYAMLSMTVYSTLPDVLLEFGIDDPQPLYQRLHRMSIEALFAVNFMAVHSVYSVQTICMLIHVGHNVGESDLIVTLMGSGIRIAQSLGLHRLGPDRPDLLEDIVDPQELTRKLIDREIGKRVWWFMIRQDWLQIPFLNTYTIHASQFNTPMPNKCPEDPRYLVQDGSVVDCNDDTYTQGSYTAVLNHVSVLIWKMQDRMLTLGHPGQSQDGLVKLYEEVIHADSELKKIMKHMPRFYREDGVVDSQLPPHIAQQRQAAMMSMAHKFFTVHRHFHVASFRNPWFSLTKLSCLPIARRSLSSLLSLPDNEYTWIVRNMWTVNTHTVTITVALLFDELFSPSDDTKMFDSADIETLARHCSSSLQEMCTRSEIAKKGVKILDFLLELNDAVKRGVCEEFNLEQIIAHVKGDLPRQDASQTDPHSLDLFDDMEWPSPGINTWESILDFIGCTD